MKCPAELPGSGVSVSVCTKLCSSLATILNRPPDSSVTRVVLQFCMMHKPCDVLALVAVSWPTNSMYILLASNNSIVVA